MTERRASFSPLAIDADAAFEVVAHEQTGGRFQVPAELVRMAVKFGATEVRIGISRREIVIEAPGAVVPGTILEAVGKVMGGGEGQARLAALELVEEAEASALVWALGLDPRRMGVAVRNGGRTMRLGAGRHRRPEVSVEPSGGMDAIEIEISGCRFDAARARRWLGIACRFVRIPVVLDGRDQRRDLDSGCFRVRIDQPIPATLALGVGLETPRLWLLRHGVVVSRVSVAGRPAFEAVVELRDVVRGRASASSVREAILPHVGALVTRAVRSTLKVVGRLESIRHDCRRRIRLCLLEAARQGIQRTAVEHAPLLELIEGGRSRWISLDALRRRPGPPPPVVDREVRNGILAGPCLLLSPAERERVADLSGIVLRAAVRRRVSVRERWKGAGRRILEGLSFLCGRLIFSRRKPSDEESALIQALEGCCTDRGRPVVVEMWRGAGRPRRWGRRLILPRRGRLTRAAVAALAYDADALYPVTVALGSPGWDIETPVRERWAIGKSRRMI